MPEVGLILAILFQMGLGVLVIAGLVIFVAVRLAIMSLAKNKMGGLLLIFKAEGPPMTPEKYLDETRFPLTTQVGTKRLGARAQIQIDSFNLGVMRDGIEDGRILTPEELARFQELEAKEKFWAEVWAQG